jgi:hypothetical protein
MLQCDVHQKFHMVVLGLKWRKLELCSLELTGHMTYCKPRTQSLSLFTALCLYSL